MIPLKYLADNPKDFLSIFNLLENNDPKNHLPYFQLTLLLPFIAFSWVASSARNMVLYDKLNFLMSKFKLASQEKYFGSAYAKFAREKMIDDTNVSQILQKINEVALKKLLDYINNHGLRRFLISCEIFNPLKTNSSPPLFIEGFAFDKNINLLMLQNEYKLYEVHSKIMIENPTNIEGYWKSMKNHFPLLSELANNYLSFLICNSEVERSFSMYRYIFSDRRKSFKETGLKTHLFFAFDNKIIKKIHNFN